MANFSFKTGALIFQDAKRVFELRPEIHWQDAHGVDQCSAPWKHPITETRVYGLRLESHDEAFTFIVEVSSESGFSVVRSRLIPAARLPFRLKRLCWQSERREGFPAPGQLVRRSLPYDVWGSCAVFPMLEPTPANKVEYWRTAIFEP